MLLINWLLKVTNHPVLQCAGPDDIVGVGCHENRRNWVPGVDEVAVELDSCHRRHMDVGDQASSFDKTRRREEIGGRRESLDAVAQATAKVFSWIREKSDHHQ